MSATTWSKALRALLIESAVTGITRVESLGAAANIFVGQSESPLVIKPYLSRLTPDIQASVNAVTTTGKIKKPLITVAGTLDGLLPIQHQARAYEDAVEGSRRGNNDHRNAQYRLYEVQNGNHIESYVTPFPELVVIQPHAQKAFDLLVDHVEKNAALPPSQCIPKDESISSTPTQAGNCAKLLAP